jgi:hypothetical protein
MLLGRGHSSREDVATWVQTVRHVFQERMRVALRAHLEIRRCPTARAGARLGNYRRRVRLRLPGEIDQPRLRR